MRYVTFGIGALFGILMFVLISQVSQEYSDVLIDWTNKMGPIGVASYLGITIIAIVVAPLGTGFLVPVAANSFGPFLAALYSIIGWVTGSIIAFFLARRYGRKYVKSFMVIKKLQTFERRLPRTSFFGFLIVLRMLFPVDIMSYTLGIGSNVNYGTFIITTVVGVSPFAFALSYAAVSSSIMQIIVSTIGTSAFFVGIYILHNQYKAIDMHKDEEKV